MHARQVPFRQSLSFSLCLSLFRSFLRVLLSGLFSSFFQLLEKWLFTLKLDHKGQEFIDKYRAFLANVQPVSSREQVRLCGCV